MYTVLECTQFWSVHSSRVYTECLHEKFALSVWYETSATCLQLQNRISWLKNYQKFLPNDPCCSYFAPLTLDFKKATTGKRVCSVFGEDRHKNSRAASICHTIKHKTTTECWCLWAALQGSTNTFPQLHQTENTNRNPRSKTPPSLLKCLAVCAMETRLCGSVYSHLSNASCTTLSGSVFTKYTTNRLCFVW